MGNGINTNMSAGGNTPPYSALSDEELIEASRAGDASSAEFLYEKYKHFIRAKARSYFLIGADREDIIQEGMIGLYKAIRDFRPEKTGSFRGFAELCVTRQIITAIKTATRQKHMPLNSYVSLNMPIYTEDHIRTLEDVLSVESISDPEEAVISQETYTAIESRLNKSLSPLERETLALYLEGLTYMEIAAQLLREPKAIDNALQRIKHKLEKQMSEGQD